MRVPDHIRRGGDLGFNMTPMIDVVFLLIIFFLVSSHLAKQEVQLALPLPTAASARADQRNDTPRLTVNVKADGTLLLFGRSVPPEELREQLSKRATRVGATLQVRIRSDRKTPYRFVEPIMLSCAHAGIWDVSFAVYRPEENR